MNMEKQLDIDIKTCLANPMKVRGFPKEKQDYLRAFLKAMQATNHAVESIAGVSRSIEWQKRRNYPSCIVPSEIAEKVLERVNNQWRYKQDDSQPGEA